MRFNQSLLCSLALLMATFASVGCTPPSDPLLEMLDADLHKTKVDDLDRTLDFIFSEVRFSQKEFEENLSNGLNRWVSYSEDKLARVEWSADETTKPLFESHKTLQMLERNEEFSFLNTDAYYLQQAAWAGQVAKRAAESKEIKPFEVYRLAADDYKPDDESDRPVEEVFQKLHPDLSNDDIYKLTSATKVNDWITRNTQLINDTTELDDDPENLRLNDRTESVAAAGIPGLGYKRYPYQTMLYGRGDYVERAKLLILALQTIDIDAVMLTVSKEDGDLPWAVGLPVGDDYYLFDTKMGLAVPGKKIGTIATLSEVRANPELLDGLDLTTDESLEDDTDYWVKGGDLKELTANIFVTPESLSKRMSALQTSLSGESRLKLYYTASEIADRLPNVEGVTPKPWNIAFQTHAFRQAVREALDQSSNNSLQAKLTWHFLNESYIDGFIIYRTARARFLKGKFQARADSNQRRNAVESFQRTMYSDADIADLGGNKLMQRLLGINQAQLDNQSFQRRITGVQSQMRLIRRDSGIFLVQSLFDNGSINAAGNWLEVLDAEDDVERWNDQINFLLGRSFEGRKEYNRALERLSGSKFVQSHGNLIRARMLKSLIDKMYGEVSTTAEDTGVEDKKMEEPKEEKIKLTEDKEEDKDAKPTEEKADTEKAEPKSDESSEKKSEESTDTKKEGDKKSDESKDESNSEGDQSEDK